MGNKIINRIKIYFSIAFIVVLIVGSFIGLAIKQNDLDTVGIQNIIGKNLKYFSYSAKAALLVQSKNNSETAQNTTVPILAYHSILPEEDSSDINTTIEKFEDQMFTLKRAGYNSITMNQLYRFLKGEEELPPNPFMITFDDGRSDSVENSDPILKALDYKAAMFVIGRFTFDEARGRYYISANNMKQMEESGRWEIGGHSYDGHDTYLTAPQERNGHFFGDLIWSETNNRKETIQEFADRIYGDMTKTKDTLSNTLGHEITGFAYPFGDFGQDKLDQPELKNTVKRITRNLFNLAFYQTAPGERFASAYFKESEKGNNFFLVKRIIVRPEWNGKELLENLEKSHIKDLPYEDNFTSDNGWISRWGDVSINVNDLSLKSIVGEYGSDTVLDGTQLWENYNFEARIISPSKTNIYLLVRYQDDANYAGCNFNNGFIHIQSVIDGKINVIKGIESPDIIIPDGEFVASASVKDRSITCTLQNNSVSSDFLDESLSIGGIGFKTWDPDPASTEIHINNMTVSPI